MLPSRLDSSAIRAFQGRRSAVRDKAGGPASEVTNDLVGRHGGECESCTKVGAKKDGDPRVKQLLDKVELKYEIDKDGDFKLINSFGNDRSQLIFINSKTVQLGTLEIREVWSVGYVASDVVPHKIVKDLLDENARVKLGAWELRRFSGKEAGVFRAQIAADTDVLSLLQTMQAVSKTADDKEQRLLAKDDL